MLAGRMLKSGCLAFVVCATAIAALLLMVGLVKATECNRFNALANSIMRRRDTEGRAQRSDIRALGRMSPADRLPQEHP